VIVAINFASPDAFLAVGTTCIVLLYIAYVMVTVPLLRQRLRGSWRGGAPAGTDAHGKPLFTLGRWGLPVNVLAVVYGVGMTINLAWPRMEVYAPASHKWYFQWFTALFVFGALVFGVAFRWWSGRSQQPAGGLEQAGQPAAVADAAEA
jgi:amino acid transporter